MNYGPMAASASYLVSLDSYGSVSTLSLPDLKLIHNQMALSSMDQMTSDCNVVFGKNGAGVFRLKLGSDPLPSIETFTHIDANGGALATSSNSVLVMSRCNLISLSKDTLAEKSRAKLCNSEYGSGGAIKVNDQRIFVLTYEALLVFDQSSGSLVKIGQFPGPFDQGNLAFDGDHYLMMSNRANELVILDVAEGQPKLAGSLTLGTNAAASAPPSMLFDKGFIYLTTEDSRVISVALGDALKSATPPLQETKISTAARISAMLEEQLFVYDGFDYYIYKLTKPGQLSSPTRLHMPRENLSAPFVFQDRFYVGVGKYGLEVQAWPLKADP